jgi:dephospho-CoA kinase
MTAPRENMKPSADPRARIMGITGGIASGKSTVAAIFAELGAAVIDADAIVRELLGSPELARKLREAWGEDYLDAEGRPDRRKIAELVFRDAERLREWTGWIHPEVRKKMKEQADSALHNPAISVIIMDAPLLIEAGLESWCDAVLFVDADPSLRAERARASRKWPEGELQRRELAQAPLDVKRRNADFIISNNGSREELFQQVERIVRQWTGPSQSHKGPSSLTSGGKT